LDQYTAPGQQAVEHARSLGAIIGLAIAENLLHGVPLCIALRHVHEALSEADSTKSAIAEYRFAFGSAALQQFHHRVGEWPEFARSLLDLPALTSHTLREQVQASLSSLYVVYPWTVKCRNKQLVFIHHSAGLLRIDDVQASYR
jgi:hypothetical protein